MSNAHLEVKRHEYKFYISFADYIYCKSVLRQLMDRDSYQHKDDGYFIRSVYFDDIYDTAVEQKLDGIENRDKYRLRIYDTKQNWARLERKSKRNIYVHKTSVPLQKQTAIRLLQGETLNGFTQDTPKANELILDMQRRHLASVVTIDYTRDAFKLDFNQIRITFDKDLRTSTSDFEIFSNDIATYPLQQSGVVILEVKYNNFLPSWLTFVMNLPSSTSSAVSKYTMSRTRQFEYYL